ncbi:hypothetical protein VTN00DRAFT_10179 [Thermoascus crustaceus]|uniref:uncharacterized protein n=1 Tax=Thermoascus crustaceus TaxID=5088 RepID=UPI0037428A43
MAPKVAADGTPDLKDYADVIDPSTFDQILEMDDDDERDFSRGIVYGFFEQAETTFEKMEKALTNENLSELSQLGHFLKGSSATLGLTKVKEACERIQHFGKDETGTEEKDNTTALAKIKQTLGEAKGDYDEVAKLLRRFYGEKV